jgi:hypothetical protein
MHFYMHSYVDKKIYSCKKWVFQDVNLNTAHTERERERAHLQNNIKAKPMQLKLSKTYPSTWT